MLRKENIEPSEGFRRSKTVIVNRMDFHGNVAVN